MEKLIPKAIELAEYHQTKLTERNLPALSKLGWLELMQTR